jgi:hypothetical protein
MIAQRDIARDSKTPLNSKEEQMNLLRYVEPVYNGDAHTGSIQLADGRMGFAGVFVAAFYRKRQPTGDAVAAYFRYRQRAATTIIRSN